VARPGVSPGPIVHGSVSVDDAEAQTLRRAIERLVNESIDLPIHRPVRGDVDVVEVSKPNATVLLVTRTSRARVDSPTPPGSACQAILRAACAVHEGVPPWHIRWCHIERLEGAQFSSPSNARFPCGFSRLT